MAQGLQFFALLLAKLRLIKGASQELLCIYRANIGDLVGIVQAELLKVF